MNLGPRLAIQGTLSGVVFLSVFLFLVSAGFSFPPAPVLAAALVEKAIQVRAPSQEMDHAIQVPVNAPPSQVDGCAVSDRFPPAVLQWCELITAYASKHGLPPDLIAALIWQESGGQPEVISHSGAVGLMQVMPNDGPAASFMCINGPCFANRPSSAELKDPEFNIAYGARLLAGLYARSGDLREALKSYGPMSVGYSYADRVLALYQQYGAQAP